MPLRANVAVKDQGYNVVSYRDAQGTSFNGRVEATSVARAAAPAAPTAGTNTTGGTLVPGTYEYRLTKIINGLETLPSTVVSQVVPAGTNTNTVTLTFANDPAASSYNIYGRAVGTPTLMASRPAGSTSYVDTGADTPGAVAVPAALAANSVNVRVPGMGVVKGVQPATALRQSNRYYNRPY
jgi:hypothetical protein